jgi:Ethanolamine utilization protein EutJ (predicted chaperonin)
MLLCTLQLINAETNKKQDEWSNVRPVLEELKDQIRAILLRSGTSVLFLSLTASPSEAA